MVLMQTSTYLQYDEGDKLIKNFSLTTSTGERVQISLYLHQFLYANRTYKGVFLKLHKENTLTNFNRIIRNVVCPILNELNLFDVDLNIIVGNDPYALLRLYEKCKAYIYSYFNVEKYPIKNDFTYNAFYTNLTELLYCSALSILSGRGAGNFGNVQHLYNIISYETSKNAFPIVVDKQLRNKQSIYIKVYKNVVHRVKWALSIKS